MYTENFPAVKNDVNKSADSVSSTSPASRRRPAWMLLIIFVLLIILSIAIFGIALNLVHSAGTSPTKNAIARAVRFTRLSSIENNSLELGKIPGNRTVISDPTPEAPQLIQKESLNENRPELKLLRHNLTDEQLLFEASVTPIHPRQYQNRTKKLALLFLTRGPLPLAPVWDLWLKGQDDLYSLYVHPKPGFTYGIEVADAFRGREIPSQDVEWGTMSIVDAERRLLANALLEADNQRFVLLSEACFPLWNFTFVYHYLMDTNVSFLQAFNDPGPHGRGRYNSNMQPEVVIDQWRKGSQWFEFTREVSQYIVADTKYYLKFREFCVPNCYVDEHYFPTMLNLVMGNRIAFRSVTWVDWSAGGWHPKTYHGEEMNKETILRMRGEFTCEWNDSRGQPCNLFARKLDSNSCETLLTLAPFMGY